MRNSCYHGPMQLCLIRRPRMLALGKVLPGRRELPVEGTGGECRSEGHFQFWSQVVVRTGRCPNLQVTHRAVGPHEAIQLQCGTAGFRYRRMSSGGEEAEVIL